MYSKAAHPTPYSVLLIFYGVCTVHSPSLRRHSASAPLPGPAECVLCMALQDPKLLRRPFRGCFDRGLRLEIPAVLPYPCTTLLVHLAPILRALETTTVTIPPTVHTIGAES
ncbi:hypothetical protein P170DRAFT_112753 [Aspergillus steynii IBT 23096]|uniref:Uncharacterized protein n=1 Tax=Aspergillus steynii IBT 23096 TaxID=1392250 RepID=A0A2I2GIU9_9EURO|nr:uncharacterized protein P170DRAFT_112753 [Aspergillus steynii IBT 23096]PLB52800.1 hypothetical protein P170DRAFT_112753 [Aspergillus steynii IBT 23096]